MKLYRYDALREPDFTDGSAPRIELKLSAFNVTKKTEKGLWIDVWGIPKFVLTNAHKHYACKTKAEALKSFIKRKQKEIKIYKERLRHAEVALERAMRMSISTNRRRVVDRQGNVHYKVAKTDAMLCNWGNGTSPIIYTKEAVNCSRCINYLYKLTQVDYWKTR